MSVTFLSVFFLLHWQFLGVFFCALFGWQAGTRGGWRMMDGWRTRRHLTALYGHAHATHARPLPTQRFKRICMDGNLTWYIRVSLGGSLHSRLWGYRATGCETTTSETNPWGGLPPFSGFIIVLPCLGGSGCTPVLVLWQAGWNDYLLSFLGSCILRSFLLLPQVKFPPFSAPHCTGCVPAC